MSEPTARPTDERSDAQRVRFDRNELAGSFGDIGTDLPLIIGILLATGADSASVFIVFGLMQILTGVVYGLPMHMQPLKAMAVLVITQKLSAGVLYGAGLAIGVIGAWCWWILRCGYSEGSIESVCSSRSSSPP